MYQLGSILYYLLFLQHFRKKNETRNISDSDESDTREESYLYYDRLDDNLRSIDQQSQEIINNKDKLLNKSVNNK